jgi:ankyrin repeat protein
VSSFWQDNEGNTALHIACHAGNTFIVRALLVFDADTDVANNNGENDCNETRTTTCVAYQDPILPKMIFPILHIFVRFSYKYV